MLCVAYKQEQDPDTEVRINRGMIERAIGALNRLSPKLKFVAFPGGTRVSSGKLSDPEIVAMLNY